MSNPRDLSPSIKTLGMAVPEPAIGSSTESPLCVSSSINRRGIWGGNLAANGWIPWEA